MINTKAPVCVPENAKFYCLLGKGTGLDLHNFMHLGYVDENGEQKTLLEIGKYYDFGLKCGEQNWLASFLFSKVGSVIKNENKMLRKQCDENISKDISYSAYEITRDQYLHFLGILRSIDQEQTETLLYHHKLLAEEAQRNASQAPSFEEMARQYYFKRLFAYQPTGENEFSYLPVSNWTFKERHTQSERSSQYLSIKCTCRHSVLDFFEDIRTEGGYGYLKPRLSSSFFLPFSCKTALQAGKYTKPLILLPQPPEAYSLSESQIKVATRLYKRMEILLEKDFDHPNTREKIDLLKGLYQDLIKDCSPKDDFLSAIVAHYNQSNNKKIISKHRGLHFPFFHHTKTKQMFERFVKDYESRINLKS